MRVSLGYLQRIVNKNQSKREILPHPIEIRSKLHADYGKVYVDNFQDAVAR